MKPVIFLVATFFSLNVLATGLLPESRCKGVFTDDLGKHDITISVHVNPENWCSETEVDNRVVISWDWMNVMFEDGTGLILATSERREVEEGEYAVFSSYDPHFSFKLEYTIIGVPARGKGKLTLDDQTVDLECSFIEYHMDC